MRLINTSNSACPLHKLCFGSPPLSIDFIVILEKLGTHSQHFSETLSNGLFLSSASLLHTHSDLHFSANLERLGRKWYSSFITDLPCISIKADHDFVGWSRKNHHPTSLLSTYDHLFVPPAQTLFHSSSLVASRPGYCLQLEPVMVSLEDMYTKAGEPCLRVVAKVYTYLTNSSHSFFDHLRAFALLLLKLLLDSLLHQVLFYMVLLHYEKNYLCFDLPSLLLQVFFFIRIWTDGGNFTSWVGFELWDYMWTCGSSHSSASPLHFHCTHNGHNLLSS